MTLNALDGARTSGPSGALLSDIAQGRAAVVYKDHMQLLGGGERSALTYAKALQCMGFSVQLFSSTPIPTTTTLLRAFGHEFADVPMHQVSRSDLAAAFAALDPLVFVNYTMNAFIRNPARVGLYCQMFPTAELRKHRRPQDWSALQTYNLIVNNSSFTKRYNDLMWDFPRDRSCVLNPALSDDSTQRARSYLDRPLMKHAKLVTVGRFNVLWNNKNQRIIIDAFQEAQRRFRELAGWKLVVMGNLNDDDKSVAYFDACAELARASNGSVELLRDCTCDRLLRELEEAFGYVHAAGAYSLPGEQPFSCEHFGRSIVEAMACGCYPIVYARGGIFDVLDVGEVGLPYITPDGLIEAMVEVARLREGLQAATLQQKLIHAALRTSFDDFVSRLSDIVGRELAA